MNAAEVIARNLGKEFLLNVATDLTVLPGGLKLRVRGRDRAIQVRMISVDRFSVNSAWPPVYGFQLRPSIEEIVGPFDDIHAEVEEIFRDTQEAYRDECMISWEAFEVARRDRHRRDWSSERRRAKSMEQCRCGCGRMLPETRNLLTRRFATAACLREWKEAHRSRGEKSAARRRRVDSTRNEVSQKVCQCGCGVFLPKSRFPSRKRFANGKSCAQRYRRKMAGKPTPEQRSEHARIASRARWSVRSST